jgi:hypothetical protein
MWNVFASTGTWRAVTKRSQSKHHRSASEVSITILYILQANPEHANVYIYVYIYIYTYIYIYIHFSLNYISSILLPSMWAAYEARRAATKKWRMPLILKYMGWGSELYILLHGKKTDSTNVRAVRACYDSSRWIFLLCCLYRMKYVVYVYRSSFLY